MQCYYYYYWQILLKCQTGTVTNTFLQYLTTEININYSHAGVGLLYLPQCQKSVYYWWPQMRHVSAKLIRKNTTGWSKAKQCTVVMYWPPLLLCLTQLAKSSVTPPWAFLSSQRLLGRSAKQAAMKITCRHNKLPWHVTINKINKFESGLQ